MMSDLWFLLSDPYTWITLLDYTLGAIFVSQWGVVYCKIKIQSSARKTCRA
uniref:Uncharacterized protein n=1 Tax=Geobacillus sp. (strain Y4.1MC1) TaxID=581103 RepID=A0A7U4DKJ5_GEOS0